MSLAIVWLLVAVLTGLSVSDIGAGPGLALLVLAALVTPALFLRRM
jgi:hypothetical protein